MTYRVVMPNFVAGVETDPYGMVIFGFGIFTAPILRRFARQDIGNLERWVRRCGGQV
jgi:hypothetical protein